MTHELVITDAGVSAANNASAAGILVDVNTFKVGQSDAASTAAMTDIQGLEIHAGSINFVEVLSETSVRFVFDVPDFIGTEEGIDLPEVGIFMPNGVMFARAVLGTAYKKFSGKAMRINAILNTAAAAISSINVTIGEFSSIPVTPYVRRLPDPSTSNFNCISVLDLNHNPDGTTAPGLALRNGAGNMHWSFTGYDRVITLQPEAQDLTQSTFKYQNLGTTLGFEDQEVLIVQILSGPGAPEVRKVRYDDVQNIFTEADGDPFPALTTSSNLAVWRSTDRDFNLTGLTLPDTTGIPADWVLTRGPATEPVWSPQKFKNGSLNTLFEPPSTFRVSVLTLAGDDRTKRYSLGGLAPETPNYIEMAVGAIGQHRSAFDLTNQDIELSEPVQGGTPIDIRVFTKEPSTGSRVDIFVDHFTGDGSTLRFALSGAIIGAEYMLVHIVGLRQTVAAATYDQATQELVFTEAPKAGHPIEVKGLQIVEAEGFSTKVHTTVTTTQDDTYYITLPFSPQNKNMVDVNINGIHLHNNTFSLSDNVIALLGKVPKERTIEVTIYENIETRGTPQTNLQGVVTDGLLSSKHLYLLRHGANPVKIPVPGVTLEAGQGIRVSGSHPFYKVESTVSEALKQDPIQKYSSMETVEDGEEVIVTQRVAVTSDRIIQVSADFHAKLGPGFVSVEGNEMMEYVVGFRATDAREPDYGRLIQGTGEAGFNALLTRGVNNVARSNASLNRTFLISKDNLATNYIDLIIKMRIRNTQVTTYGSLLVANFNAIVFPLID